MSDMPVPGSFRNIGHEGSDHVKLCCSNKVQIEESQSKFSFIQSDSALNVDE